MEADFSEVYLYKKKDEEPAQQGQKPLQPAEITPFIPYEKGRAHREFVPFLLKIILIYRNVCTVLKTILTCKLDAADPQDLRLHQES